MGTGNTVFISQGAAQSRVQHAQDVMALRWDSCSKSWHHNCSRQLDCQWHSLPPLPQLLPLQRTASHQNTKQAQARKKPQCASGMGPHEKTSSQVTSSTEHIKDLFPLWQRDWQVWTNTNINDYLLSFMFYEAVYINNICEHAVEQQPLKSRNWPNKYFK